VREVVQGSGGTNDENAWMCIDGPKREGRTRQNGKVEKWTKRKKEMDSKQILVGNKRKELRKMASCGFSSAALATRE
jgi:hypothetical protein